MKKIVTFFNNFKKTARSMMITSGASVIMVILTLVAFQISGGKDADGKSIPAFSSVAVNLQKLGMVFFILLVLLTICAITVFYRSIPFAFPKEKNTPIKSIPWTAFATGILNVLVAVMCLLVPVLDKTIHATFWYILLVVNLLVGAANILWFYPAKKCHFFMPSLLEEKK